MKKLVIFDYDGVIADSEIVFHSVFIAELKKFGVEITSEELSRKFSGNSTAPFNERIYEYCGIKLPKSFYPETSKKVFDNIDRVKLNPNAVELITELKSRNIDYCIASGGRREWTLQTMSQMNIKKYFPDEIIYTRESVVNGKPAPDIFLNVVDRYKIKKEDCLIIEDSMNGLRAGISSDIQTIAYIGGSHITHNYIEDIKKLEIEMVNDLLDVVGYL